MTEGWGVVAIPSALGVATLALFAVRRVRADAVAVLSLMAAVLLGLVPGNVALSGFSHPVVITVAALSILGGAAQRSGIVELPGRWLGRRVRMTPAVLLCSGLLVAALAAISGRVGTRNAVVAPLLPVHRGPDTLRPGHVIQLNTVCLLGGLLTVVGGVPNLLVSNVRADLAGAEFRVLDFLPVGAILLGMAAVTFAVGSLLRGRRADTARAAPVPGARQAGRFTNEFHVPPPSPMVGRTVAELEAEEDGAVHVVALVREGYRRVTARPDWRIEPGDVLVLDCEPGVLQRLIERDGLHAGAASALTEAVVTPNSELIGHSSDALGLVTRHGLHLLGIGRTADAPPGRLRRTRLRAGDVLVLAGNHGTIRGVLTGLGCLVLAERRLRAGRRQQIVLPVAALLAALAAASMGLAPLWLALLAGVLALVLTGTLTLRDAYDASPWPGVVLLASLLPLAAALHGSAPAEALAQLAAAPAAELPLWLDILAAIAATILLTGLFGSAVAVLLLAPLAVAVALAAALPVDALLFAVAVGAASDLLDGSPGPLLIPATTRRPVGGWPFRLGAKTLLLCGGTLAVLIGWPL